jgi:4-diphosphocytidyl-2-C-methyl-D-erythritol kinase
MPRQNPENEIILRSGCKINLYLKITGLLPDGYHNIQTFMLPLEKPFDILKITPGRQRGLTLFCKTQYIDLKNNTLQKAYTLFSRQAPYCPDLKIVLEKNVPVGAGLGGGSADAATLLLFLEERLKQAGFHGTGQDKLLELAAKVGADVPFFILNRAAWAEGIGEKLTPAPLELSFKGTYLLLVCPDIHISTAWAYAEWDKLQLTRHPSQVNNLPSAEFKLQGLFNSFEQAVFPCYPQLVEIKQKLLKLGAIDSLMSGSGSSLFGFFAAQEQVEAAGKVFKESGFRVYTQAIM